MPVFTFSNSSPIYFHTCETTSTTTQNSAHPYPSLIHVFALPSNVSNISVHLYGLQAESLHNVSILFVAPKFNSNLVLMNAIDTPYPQTWKQVRVDSTIQTSVDISIIDDSAPMPLFGPLLNNSFYRPTSYSPVFLPPDGPLSPYHQPPFFGTSSFVSSFISPNISLDGSWALYVFSSDNEKKSFSISGGWSISFYNDIPDSNN